MFVFEETARENRERTEREERERERFCAFGAATHKTRKDCKSSERYEENARALKHALY